MRILIISRGVPSVDNPQWGSFELTQAEALASIGHEVIVISIDRRFHPLKRKPGIVYKNYKGIPCYDSYLLPTPFTKQLGTSYQFLIFKPQLKRLIKIIKNNHGLPDLIYAHYLIHSEMGVYLKEKFGIPVVGIEHWSRIGQKNLLRRDRVRAERTYARLDALITVSSDLRNKIKNNLGFDSIVVNNILTSGFEYRENINKSDVIKFVSTGNLLPIKGFDILIRAFAKYNNVSQKWKLTIIGEGRERETLHELIKKYDLEDKVQLPGRKEPQEVALYLHKSDVFVVSSYTETFGVAALEAVACGLPVISTDCGGPRDFIDETNGLFCKAGDVDSMFNAIIKMTENLTRYDRKLMSSRIINKYSGEAIANRLTEIFEDVIKNKK